MKLQRYRVSGEFWFWRYKWDFGDREAAYRRYRLMAWLTRFGRTGNGVSVHPLE